MTYAPTWIIIIVQIIGWLLWLKVTYLYYRVSSTSPGIPKYDLKAKYSKMKTKKEIDTNLPLDQTVAKKYSKDIAEVVRYSPIAAQDFEHFQSVLKNLPAEEKAFCTKCNFVKPLRAHHCSVCNQCVLLMDHHCMWTNNCIGLNNYKQFI